MERINDIGSLHPKFKVPYDELRFALRREGIPLDSYETGRTPTRQHRLWLQGRFDPGPNVRPDKPLGDMCTWSNAWHSFHQYWLAADSVFWLKDKFGKLQPSWVEPERGMWARYHELALQHGLTPLYDRHNKIMEMPHVQLRGVAIDALLRGEYPEGGNDLWEHAMCAMIQDGVSAGMQCPPLPHGRPTIVEGDAT